MLKIPSMVLLKKKENAAMKYKRCLLNVKETINWFCLRACAFSQGLVLISSKLIFTKKKNDTVFLFIQK